MHARDHDCLRVATQTVFEQSRELGVALRHEYPLFGLVAQSVDAVRECKQTAVDLGALSQTDAPVLGDRTPLRSSQVDEVQLTVLALCILGVITVLGLDQDLEDSVRARGGLVGVGGLGSPPAISSEEKLHDLFRIVHTIVGDACDADSCRGVLP